MNYFKWFELLGIALCSSIRESSNRKTVRRTCGTFNFRGFRYPALTRWANLCRPSGAANSEIGIPGGSVLPRDELSHKRTVSGCKRECWRWLFNDLRLI